MKKKIISSIIAIASAALLAACGTSEAANSDNSNLQTVDSVSDSVSEQKAETAEKKEEAEAEDVTIGYTASEFHIAIQPSAAFIPLYIAREKGWIEEALSEYNVEVTWNDFESGPPMNESLAAGLSDIGVIGDVPTVSAIAAGQKNEVIAIAAQAADSYAVLVTPDSDIQTASDLAGKKVATVIGSTGHNLVQKFLKTAGLSIDDLADGEVINISAGDAATVLANGEVDAVAIWEPSVTRLVDSNVARIIGEGTDAGLAGTNTIVARKEFSEANPLIIRILLEQYARAAAEIQTLDDETWEKVAEDLSLEVDQVKSILPKYNFSVEITQEDIDALNDTIDFLVGIERIDSAYDIGEYTNSSYYSK